MTSNQDLILGLKKANAIVGLIRRSFTFLDCELCKKLFTTFVRPHFDLEYVLAVWSQHLQKHINVIENVQIRATELVDGLSNLDYADRLRKLNLPLVHRRKRGDMIETYKHFHVYDKVTLSTLFQPQLRNNHGHNFQLIWQRPKNGINGTQATSFYYRCAQVWNGPRDEVVNAPNVNDFKNRIDELWKDDASKYNHTLRPSDSQRQFFCLRICIS